MYEEIKDVSDGGRRRDDFEYRLRLLKTKPRILKQPQALLHNHLPQNGLLGNKKAMFYSLREYYRLLNRDVFSTVPLTFHIQNGTQDP
jgi:hypothetical protein